jgi:hypothetical protein
MLVLKLLLVSAFLLAVSLAGRRWGAAVAGWLAGLPVVAGPVLFFIAVEQGTGFAAQAATASLSAVFASVAFSLAYAHAAHRMPWWAALLPGLGAWSGTAWVLWAMSPTWIEALLIAMVTLWFAPHLFPAAAAPGSARPQGRLELACRMLAGAALTLAVTWASGRVGTGWSGLLAVFPILGIVLAVFSHRTLGPAYAAALLRAMATGLYSFVAFCAALALALPELGLSLGFVLAIVASLLAQAATRHRLRKPSGVKA